MFQRLYLNVPEAILVPDENNATPWPYLASWDLQDFQLSFNSKIGPSVAIPSWLSLCSCTEGTVSSTVSMHSTSC
jgi:hypothetical protein